MEWRAFAGRLTVCLFVITAVIVLGTVLVSETTEAGSSAADKDVLASKSPGLTVSEGYYFDLQHSGSTGRQIDESNGNVSVTWATTTVTGTPNHVAYNTSIHVSGPVSGGEGPLITASGLGFFADDDAKYPSLRKKSDGLSVIVYHLDQTGGFRGQDEYIPGGFGPIDVASGTSGWPKIAISSVGADQYLHVVTLDANETPLGRIVTYYRATPTGPFWFWETPVLLDFTTSISPVVEARGAYVAVVFAKPRSAGAIADADIVYCASTDAGVTWSSPINITNYADSDPDKAFTDIDAVIDENGVLHVVWNTQHRYLDEPPSVIPTKLWHWSSITGIRMITAAAWHNTCTSAPNEGVGADNLLISKPSISVKPAGVHGIPAEVIYTTWVQFGPTTSDCAANTGRYVNGELYCSASSNDGMTWDRPQNITGSQTPDCVSGDCASDHWVTAAAYADSLIFLSYVEDTDPGAFQLGEGDPTTGYYKVLAIEARPPVLEPCIFVYPSNFQLCLAPGAAGSVDFQIHNTCNANLNYTATVTSLNSGNLYLTVNEALFANGTVPAGAAPSIITLGYDVAGLPDGVYDWQIEVVSNDHTNDPNQGGDPIYIDVLVEVNSAVTVRSQSACTFVVCPITLTGDVNLNGSVTSGDIIYLVNFVFKGGPAPLPCEASGDVNCSGTVTSSDIIYLVGFVFKGGIPPCDVCTLFPDTWTCP